MSRRDIARQIRERILEYIEDSPGTHFSDIRRQLQLSSGRLSYHISKLEREKKIFSEYDGYWKRFFSISVKRKKLPQVLNPMSKEIAAIIRENPGATYMEIVEIWGKTRQAVMYHTKMLLERGIIRAKWRNRKYHFYPRRKKYI